MIIKGSSRAGPSQLGRHLQRTDTNGHVQILELQSPTGNLTEALRDWQVLCDGTRGTKGMYHANIDPDARYKMTPEQWQRAVDVLEKELGLTGQPRAIVLHEKNGREHIHVVWQRTDVETMTLKSDSNNYYAHERASMALEKEFGHEHVPGKHAKRDRDKPPPKAEFNHAEWQQAERDGIDPRARKEAITDIFQRCDTGQGFRAALSDIGFILAKGDRRDFVLVDQLGQVHSLGRQINGVRAKDLREFMADIERDSIPTIEQAKALQRDRAASKSEGRTQEQQPPKIESAPEQPKPAEGVSEQERIKLETALKARYEEEGHALRVRQEAEFKRTTEIFNREINERAAAFDAVQDAARDRYEREHNPAKRGLDAMTAKVKAKLDPDEAVREAWRREQARDDYFKRLQADRALWLAQQLAAKERDLNNLTDRHEQQRREHAATYERERTRYLREQEAAKRLLVELEERRQKAKRLTRDGPEPPGRAR